jgi:peptidyl-dipeptidase A
MAQASFECRAYEAVDGDLNGLWCDVVDRFLGVPSDEMPGWAHNLFWSSHPIYIQNYVIGEVVASQTLNALRDQFGGVDNRDIGAWLTANYFEAGASVPWRQKVVHATGAALSTDALLAELTGSALS